jgi:hypothetical protein
MLNRTNLTQTALLNGLNLGTRSLVLGTSLNTNGQALTVRKSHHGVMRVGMSWYVVKPIIDSIYDDPAIPILASGLPRIPSSSFESKSKSPRPLRFKKRRPCARFGSIEGRPGELAAAAPRRARALAAAAAASAAAGA